MQANRRAFSINTKIKEKSALLKLFKLYITQTRTSTNEYFDPKYFSFLQ